MTIQIGGTSVGIRSDNSEFRLMLAARYSGFLTSTHSADYVFDVELIEPSEGASADEDVAVSRSDEQWQLTRGDFHANWNASTTRGHVRQANNPYAIDSVLRIVHTLILANRGGFLLHSASAIRNGNAFLFSGVSGAGKTTISRLAPSDATLLTDEISYVVRQNGHYMAYGTPFSGELGRAGENRSAPIKTLFFLEKARENRIAAVDSAEAVRLLLRNVLFFAADPELVKMIFASACEFVETVAVRRLYFTPDERVWQMIV